MKATVPFYGQHWNLDQWEAMGYKNREHAQYWEKSCCGILCIKMAMDSFRLRSKQSLTPSVKELIDLGFLHNAYSDATGWSHKGLIALIEIFGYKAHSGKVTIELLKEALTKNELAIVSIKWAFQSRKSLKEKILFWKKYGGHLAVVVGFEEEAGELVGFYVHHTSKIKEQNWESRLIPIDEFKKGFTGRGIIVSSCS